MKKLAFSTLVISSALVLFSGNANALMNSTTAGTELTAVNTNVSTAAEGRMNIMGGVIAFVGGCGIFAKMV
jgi:hypothetical protein